MNKLIRIFIQWFMALVIPIIFILLFGEVGIKLHLQTFDKDFWFCLIFGYILLFITFLDVFYIEDSQKNELKKE